MIHRLALIIGSLAAAAVLAIGVAAAGPAPAGSPADTQLSLGAPTAVEGAATDTAAVEPITRVETTTIYVRPARKPKVIHVTRRAPAPTTSRVKVVRARTSNHGDDGGERDDEREGGDD